jgi:hypothetical protein
MMSVHSQQELHTQGFVVSPQVKIEKAVETMQWVLLCLSIFHDRCYLEHIAQHSTVVLEHPHAGTTFVL